FSHASQHLLAFVLLRHLHPVLKIGNTFLLSILAFADAVLILVPCDRFRTQSLHPEYLLQPCSTLLRYEFPFFHFPQLFHYVLISILLSSYLTASMFERI